MTSKVVSCELALPADFRLAEALEFHRRDREQVAERVWLDEAETSGRLEKAFIRQGQAVLLAAELNEGGLRAEFRLEPVPGRASMAPDFDQATGAALLAHLFGLQQPVTAFEQRFADHPELGPLLGRNAGLRVVQVSSPFEALSWAIIGQQISLAAAIALRRKFIQALGWRHGSGLHCYPDAVSVAETDLALLRGLGCSQTKAAALLAVARAVVAGELPLDEWLDRLNATRQPTDANNRDGREPTAAGVVQAQLIDEIRERLLAIRGVGPWTLNYSLLRGFGWLDGGLEGDVAVRRGLQRLQELEVAPTERQARDWLAAFQPWRALVAAHLWTLSAGPAGA